MFNVLEKIWKFRSLKQLLYVAWSFDVLETFFCCSLGKFKTDQLWEKKRCFFSMKMSTLKVNLFWLQTFHHLQETKFKPWKMTIHIANLTAWLEEKKKANQTQNSIFWSNFHPARQRKKVDVQNYLWHKLSLLDFSIPVTPEPEKCFEQPTWPHDRKRERECKSRKEFLVPRWLMWL